jgi:hypothetical protein
MKCCPLLAMTGEFGNAGENLQSNVSYPQIGLTREGYCIIFKRATQG